MPARRNDPLSADDARALLERALPVAVADIALAVLGVHENNNGLIVTLRLTHGGASSEQAVLLVQRGRRADDARFVEGWALAVRAVIERGDPARLAQGFLSVASGAFGVRPSGLPSAEAWRDKLLSPSELGRFLPPAAGEDEVFPRASALALLARVLPVEAPLVELRINETGDDGLIASDAGLRARLQVLTFEGVDGERIVRDVKEQEVLLFAAKARVPVERSLAFVEGWALALGEVFRAPDLSRIETAMPLDLVPSGVIRLKRPSTPAEFARAMLEPSRLGRFMLAPRA